MKNVWNIDKTEYIRYISETKHWRLLQRKTKVEYWYFVGHKWLMQSSILRSFVPLVAISNILSDVLFIQIVLIFILLLIKNFRQYTTIKGINIIIVIWYFKIIPYGKTNKMRILKLEIYLVVKLPSIIIILILLVFVVSIARLCHIGHGFLKFSLILLNSDRKIYGDVM